MIGFFCALGIAGWFWLSVEIIRVQVEIDFIRQRLIELRDIEDDFEL